MSLRKRVVIGVIVVAAVLVLTNVAFARMFESFLVRAVDRQLTDVAGRPPIRGERPRPQPLGAEPLSEFFLAVGRADGSGLMRVASPLAADDPPPALDPAAVRARAARGGQRAEPWTAPAQTGDGRWRMVAVVAPRGERLTVVGASLDAVDTTVTRVRRVQVLGTLAALAALGLVSWWMLRLGVHPIEDMADAADAIAAGGLSARVPHPPADTEAGRLGIALNAMLDRIEDSFRAQQATEHRLRRFAADASHELRTPLTSIQGYAELYRRGALATDADMADAMRRMEEEARRMAGLVDDLLLLARLDQQRPLESSDVRLDNIAADAVADARAVEPSRPVEMRAAPTTVVGDEMRLRQVVANLLTNARDHTPPGTPVRVEVGVEGDRAHVVVADDGPGMPADVAAKVFDRFYRADAARDRATGGSGLGLAIVAAIVEAHAGSASVRSAPGEGSVFRIELPVERASMPT